MRSLDFIAESTNNASERIRSLKLEDKLVSPHFEKVLAAYRVTLGWMLDRHPLTRQEVMDFNEELDRLDYYMQLMIRRSINSCNPNGNTKAYQVYLQAEQEVTRSGQFTVDRKNRFKGYLAELDDLLKSGLGITDRERRQILEAMGMGQGHWYKCPNGHIYIITECGGAMEVARCNECGAGIGGGSHRLLGDNQLATEMDGARAPAWPTGMQGY